MFILLLDVFLQGMPKCPDILIIGVEDIKVTS